MVRDRSTSNAGSGTMKMSSGRQMTRPRSVSASNALARSLRCGMWIFTICMAYPLDRSTRLNPHHIIPAIHIQHVPRNPRSERAAQEDRGVGDLRWLDAALQGRALGRVADHLVDIADGAGGTRCVRPRRD